jgi:hypothetical protein
MPLTAKMPNVASTYLLAALIVCTRRVRLVRYLRTGYLCDLTYRQRAGTGASADAGDGDGDGDAREKVYVAMPHWRRPELIMNSRVDKSCRARLARDYG